MDYSPQGHKELDRIERLSTVTDVENSLMVTQGLTGRWDELIGRLGDMNWEIHTTSYSRGFPDSGIEPVPPVSPVSQASSLLTKPSAEILHINRELTCTL